MTETGCWLSDSFLPQQGEGEKEMGAQRLPPRRRAVKAASVGEEQPKQHFTKQFKVHHISLCHSSSCTAALKSSWNVIIWFINKIWYKKKVKVLISWLFQRLVWNSWKQNDTERILCICVYLCGWMAASQMPVSFLPLHCPRFALEIIRASLCCVWILAIAIIFSGFTVPVSQMEGRTTKKKKCIWLYVKQTAQTKAVRGCFTVNQLRKCTVQYQAKGLSPPVSPHILFPRSQNFSFPSRFSEGFSKVFLRTLSALSLILRPALL